MIAWENLDPAVLDTMKELGDFSPTSSAQYREVKGYTYREGEGSKTYWSTDELKHISKHLMIVARWLEQRADEERIKNG